MKRILILFISTLLTFAITELDIDLFPMPHTINVGEQLITLNSPCSILYELQLPTNQFKHIQTIIKHYQLKAFNCRNINFIPTPLQTLKMKNIEYRVKIKIVNSLLKSVYTIHQEQYLLKIDQKYTTIQSQTYVGFVRALQTFTQTFSCSQNKTMPCTIAKAPIQISDAPEFSHRGIMIDTAKHYLPKHLILQTIDAMMYNKMNVLHWHITDDDSFPLALNSSPQLSQYGAFSKQQVYTKQDVKQIVEYGMIRGVRIIPQLSTPARSSSWVKSDSYKSIRGCAKQRDQLGGFNIHNNDTFYLIKSVFQEVMELFPDNLFHLGGEPLPIQCATDSSGVDFNLQYRKKQKQILKQIDPLKKYIYYHSQTSFEDDDIVHSTDDLLPQIPNKIIISHNRIHNLANGVGNKYGYSTGGYSVWMQIYFYNIKNLIKGYQNSQNVLGAEMMLQSDNSNEYTHHIKLWMRSSTLAQLLWNSQIPNVKPYVLKRMTRHQRVMDKRGIPTAPITGQICEINPQFC